VQKFKFFNEEHKNPPLAGEFPPLQRGIKGDLRSSEVIGNQIKLTFCIETSAWGNFKVI